MAVCFLLTRLLMLSFCLSACPSVCWSFLWIIDNGGTTLWWVSPWVGMVHDWSDTRKMKRKMRVYMSSSASSGLLGRKSPKRHIYFNNSNVYISPRILLKNLHWFFFQDYGQTIKKWTAPSSVFQLRSYSEFSSRYCITVLWCNLINIHHISRQANSSNLFFIVCVLGRGSRELSNLYGDKG